MREETKIRLRALSIAFCVIACAICVLFALDQTATSIERIGAVTGVIAFTSATYLSYSEYREAMEEYHKRSQVVITPVNSLISKSCPVCGSSNVLQDNSHLYCLSCGKVSKLAKEVRSSH